ncbi:MAG: hypothetical protein ACI9XO_003422 [Paraglaciecola sp.]|jgi:hypothetical protein
MAKRKENGKEQSLYILKLPAYNLNSKERNTINLVRLDKILPAQLPCIT